ncbi:unnamed protein product [Adineta steineri]|uniref:AB hydrolase-1 domain-containing protein n=1 Tax=Adineta steineri TaxID=433720 RepID=A0A815S669_9BILA|nr:unnamed protein product [Adineta steineri]CAF4037843.1 unnamed protein product [Adineta steineri]
MLQIWILLLIFIGSFNLASATVQCDKKIIQVSLNLNDTGPISYPIVTWFCWKNGTVLTANQTIHLTISGFTYDHTYWDFPYQPYNYSYINYVIENSNENIAVLNFDRFGVGLSGKPLFASTITGDVHAFVIYQLMEKLSQGYYHNISFPKIVLVGHALGTEIALIVASNNVYNQYVCGVIATGFLHLINPPSFASFFASLYPAVDDPKFKNQLVPADSLTTNPNTTQRQDLFYNIQDADIKVIDKDEQLKAIGSASEFTVARLFIPIETRNIPTTIPILIVMGQRDILSCDLLNITLSCNDANTIINREKDDYITNIEAYVLENSGHDVNLHRNARDWFQAALDWSNKLSFQNCGCSK